MNELAAKKCVPCETGKALDQAGIDQLKAKLPGGWNVVDNRKLEKSYKFKDFRQALQFTNQVGELAEEAGHHPDIYLTWGKVKIELSTHSANGLTENDFILAAQIEERIKQPSQG